MNDTSEPNNPLQALKKIKQAEEKARRIKQEARQEASQKIVEDARKEAREIRESVLEKARKQAEEMKDKIIQDAQKQAEDIRRQAEGEINSVRKKAGPRKKEAVNKAAETIRRRFTEGKD